jgi:hypothetical protein
MKKTFARGALVFSVTLLVALVSSTTARTARADGPTKVGGTTAGALAQESKPKAKTVAKATTSPGKPHAKTASKPAAGTPKLARSITPKEEGAKPAEAAKEGEPAPGSRAARAGKVDGSKWRPRHHR